jgi:hypothetical protein
VANRYAACVDYRSIYKIALKTLQHNITPESRWCFAELAVAKRMKSGIQIIPPVISDLDHTGWLKSGVDRLQKFQFDQNATSEQRVAMLEILLLQLKRLGLGPAVHIQPAIDNHPDRVHFRCETWEQWSLHPDMSVLLQAGPDQEAVIASLSKQLTVKGRDSIHVCEKRQHR